jgi:hypothetical protein
VKTPSWQRYYEGTHIYVPLHSSKYLELMLIDLQLPLLLLLICNKINVTIAKWRGGFCAKLSTCAWRGLQRVSTWHLTLPRKKHLVESGEVKQAFDLMAALQWSQFVSDEGGDNYASTVKWCFTSASNENKSWRGDIIRNVIRQLELYQDKGTLKWQLWRELEPPTVGFRILHPYNPSVMQSYLVAQING